MPLPSDLIYYHMSNCAAVAVTVYVSDFTVVRCHCFSLPKSPEQAHRILAAIMSKVQVVYSTSKTTAYLWGKGGGKGQLTLHPRACVLEMKSSVHPKSSKTGCCSGIT